MKIFVLLISVQFAFYSQKVMKTVILRDSLTHETLVNIEVQINRLPFNISDKNGKIIINAYQNDTITFCDINYITKSLIFMEISANILLSEKIYSDSILEIRSNSNPIINSHFNGLNIIQQKSIKEFPHFFGESDALKTIQNKNGVSLGKDLSNKFFVRGGQSDQNLFLIDGAKIYQSSHLFGFFSVFHANAIKQIEFYKSNFPIEYSGALASIIDFHYKSGNKNKIQYGAGLGFLNSHFYIDGPISSNNTFSLAFRKSYYDLIIYALNKKQSENTELMNIFDLSLKITHHFSDLDKIEFISFFSKDKIAGQINWSSSINKLTLHNNLSSNLINTTHLSFSNYKKHYFNSLFGTKNSTSQNLDDISTKTDFTYYFSSNSQFQFGLEYNFINNNFTDKEFHSDQIIQKFQYSRFYSAYLVKNILTDLDLQLAGGLTFYRKQQYTEPRISLAYQLNKKQRLKWHYNLLRQYHFSLNSSMLGDDFTSIFFSDNDYKPQFSHFTALDYENEISGITLQSEIYFKRIENLYLIQSDIFQSNLPKLDRGFGRAYGFDFNVEGDFSKHVNFWGSFAYQQATWQFENLNKGRPFQAKFLKPFQVQLFINKKKSESWSYSVSAYVGSGFLITTPKSYYPFAMTRIYNFDEFNNFRTSINNRVDFTINHHFSWFKEKSKLSLTLYNILFSQNPLAVYFHGVQQNLIYVNMGFFPSLSYSFEM